MVTAIIQRCSGTTDERCGNIITKERDDGSKYSGVDGHSGVSSPCGAVEVTIWS